MRCLPPLLLRLRISSAERPWPSLWLPLFLLWLLLLPLLIVASVIALPLWLLLFVSAPPAARAALAVLGASYRLLCETRGLHVAVEGPTAVVISVY